jgi:hypothetical protein
VLLNINKGNVIKSNTIKDIKKPNTDNKRLAFMIFKAQHGMQKHSTQ